MIWIILCCIFCLLGSFLLVIAALGLLRMPDLYTRMHAATKAPTLGLTLLLLAAACFFHSLAVLGIVVVVIIFTVMTTPVAAHLLAHSAYQLGEHWHNKAEEDAYQQHLNDLEKSGDK